MWGDAGAEAALGLRHWPLLISPGPEAGNKGRRPWGRVAVHVRAYRYYPTCEKSLPISAHAPLISLLEPLYGRVTLIQPAASSYGGTATKPITLSCQLLTHPGIPQSPVQEESWPSTSLEQLQERLP